MSWNGVIGVFLLGGFVVYLIGAGKINDYLALFVSGGPSAAASAAPATGGISSFLPSLSGLTGGLL